LTAWSDCYKILIPYGDIDRPMKLACSNFLACLGSLADQNFVHSKFVCLIQIYGKRKADIKVTAFGECEKFLFRFVAYGAAELFGPYVYRREHDERQGKRRD